MRLKYLIVTVCLIGALLCAVGIVRGADAPKPDPPKITVEMQAAYFQARAEVAEAQIATTAAQARFEAAVKAMQAVCPLELGQDRKPQCVPPAKAEAPKK